MEDVFERIAAKTSKTEKKGLQVTAIDLKYAYGQLYFDEETSKHCVFALITANFNCTLKKSFYVLINILTIL